MAQTSSLPGRTAVIDDKEYLYFSGTSYLGIPHNELYRSYIFEGMQLYGSNYSSSRISNLQLSIYEEAEAYLANYIGTETSLTASSGFLAGKILLELIAEKENIFYSPNSHPALRLPKMECVCRGYSEWVDKLLIQLKNLKEEVFIICNSIDPLFLVPTSFSWIKEVPKEIIITLIVDDSHGLGIIGEEGRGILASIPKKENLEIVVISSLGKAFGVPGGVVAGGRKIIESLKALPAFGSSSPIVPAYLYSFLKAETLYKNCREKLQNNIKHFKDATRETDLFRSLPLFPVFYSIDNRLYEALYSSDILISSFSYPSPSDDLITRIVINALHTEQDLEKLALEVNKFWRMRKTKT